MNFLELCNAIQLKEESLSIIGLGYVGLPIAVAFSNKANVIGFDTNLKKVKSYSEGLDATNEVGNKQLVNSKIKFTSDERMLKNSKFHIIAVPTPVNEEHVPDLSCIKDASRILGRNLSKGSIVVYESTVYPGVTEEICLPILEEESGLKCGVDFKIGYSPERINPADRLHKLESIVKVVSGMDEEALEVIAQVYGLIIEAGIYRAQSIKVAEAAKVIENSQRDINIAFMNELSIILGKMDIDTKAVINAAKTKWNFMDFYPGLVGGHCIGVDPYYLTYKAEQYGYTSQIISSGRQINEYMSKYIVECLIKGLMNIGFQVRNAIIGILGVTFKENCPDMRNSKVLDMINEIKSYGLECKIVDPIADATLAKEEYNVDIIGMDKLRNADAIILSVPHEQFLTLEEKNIYEMFKCKQTKFIMDIKGALEKDLFEGRGYKYWRL